MRRIVVGAVALFILVPTALYPAASASPQQNDADATTVISATWKAGFIETDCTFNQVFRCTHETDSEAAGITPAAHTRCREVQASGSGARLEVGCQAMSSSAGFVTWGRERQWERQRNARPQRTLPWLLHA